MAAKVSSALSGDEAGLGAIAGEQGVVDYSGAVHEHRGLGKQRFVGCSHAGCCIGDRIQHALREIRRGRQRLTQIERLARGEDNGVGTGSTDVGRDNIFFCTRVARAFSTSLRRHSEGQTI